jgi:hypothetical protein
LLGLDEYRLKDPFQEDYIPTLSHYPPRKDNNQQAQLLHEKRLTLMGKIGAENVESGKTTAGCLQIRMIGLLCHSSQFMGHLPQLMNQTAVVHPKSHSRAAFRQYNSSQLANAGSSQSLLRGHHSSNM